LDDRPSARKVRQVWLPVLSIVGSDSMPLPPDPSPWHLEWNDSLSVSIPEIDAEHQNFILLVNKLNQAIIGHMDVEKVKYCMQSILLDAEKHFAHEEQLFKQWGYQDEEEHARKHAEVTRALDGIMAHFEQGRQDYEWIEAGLKVKEALIGHMLSEDMKCRDFCTSQAARSDIDPKK
jgi:hemerythrin-like metal-binding protein